MATTTNTPTTVAAAPMSTSLRNVAPVAELLLDSDAPASDALELFVFGNDDGSHARLVARLDNLGKGASGAAVQNLNLMCGLPETAGLRLTLA